MKACVRIHEMLLTSPTFNIEILPNALAALPELFAGLDDILPALDLQLEETWPRRSRPCHGSTDYGQHRASHPRLTVHFLGKSRTRLQPNWRVYWILDVKCAGCQKERPKEIG